ncbi:hypothetical protein HDE76_003748 [Rhodanobacter sp. ANJX3]|uniref:hypothetical protein n=1 Tax=Rhodanobacter sp. ANJX3 TaxID=2723083 RepID=UPI0016211D51|nr:hypothetical protein [Rhodanobacter sp. ANJX3]MBB5360504.1 hypothetical protein [Rhodanobacter sp. ANJX3]
MDQVFGDTGYRQSVLASASYPRTYRYSTAVRWLIYAIAAAMMAGGIWMVFMQIRQASAPAVFLWLGMTALGLGLFMAASCTVACLTLRADAIEVRRLFSTRRLRRDEIEGRRLVPTRGKPISLLVARSGPPLRLDSGYRGDSVLDAWIATLPDLDRQERDASQARLAADRSYGASPQERLSRLDTARQFAKVAQVATLAVSAWAYVYPRPYLPVIALVALLPWCAVALVGWSRGLIRFDTTRNDVRPNIAIMLILPGVVLGVRALFDTHMLDVSSVLEYGVVVGLPLLAAVMLVNGRRDRTRAWGWGALLLALVALPYGAGVLSLSDVLLDQQPPQVFSTQVQGKYISSGKHPQPYLVLAPWGPETMGDKVAVSRAYYAQTPVNATVCAALHPGSVKLRWFDLRECPSTTAGTHSAKP